MGEGYEDEEKSMWGGVGVKLGQFNNSNGSARIEDGIQG
jgi:hypothetical protein